MPVTTGPRGNATSRGENVARSRGRVVEGRDSVCPFVRRSCHAMHRWDGVNVVVFPA